MPAHKKQPEINLLPVDKFAQTSFGRTINWFISTFRAIVILVELVVMLAFLSRFWLDAKNSDLNDEISQKQALIVASSQLENDYNLWAKKEHIFSALIGNGRSYSDLITAITVRVPPEISTGQINLSSSGSYLAGTAATEADLKQLLANLKAEKLISEVTINRLVTNSETGNLDFRIDFKIAGETKPQPKTSGFFSVLQSFSGPITPLSEQPPMIKSGFLPKSDKFWVISKGES